MFLDALSHESHPGGSESSGRESASPANMKKQSFKAPRKMAIVSACLFFYF